MNSNVENLPPHIIRLVYKEVTTLTADPPDGIKVFPNEEDLTDLQVTIEGPEGTPYAGGLFRMKLLLGKDFPASPPKGYFLTKIFHPNVGANGEICVNVLKRDWTAELGIRHVLLLSWKDKQCQTQDTQVLLRSAQEHLTMQRVVSLYCRMVFLFSLFFKKQG
ncbi:ubiquitin-conjugating enzyme E2 S isoform X1 [Homo sapiens]|uniref:ubiquitin-conjugating enzyme E2 S isoform X1 n=1 Tax=Homo sapiens TaxID=9606 RepID=UPI0005D0191E|nr:ubiquitin-conjugating enzyme E2 S isoform X1 [Homo sapiens]XP_054176554.1 ubiquitin-conjugating enzyme E2 S isoform X1 [Homo sapiens]|eukprot:XP_011525054.1 ubiquitin-conjugating enzyme E2 S isoform X1 [Homo sapiens]